MPLHPVIPPTLSIRQAGSSQIRRWPCRFPQKMASPVAPCSGVYAPVAKRRTDAQGRGLDHLVQDRGVTRSRSCSQYVPIDHGLLHGALEDSAIARNEGMQSAVSAYDLLTAQKHVIRIGVPSNDGLSLSLLEHYAFRCTAEGEPQVGLVTKVAPSCEAFVAHVQISPLPWSTTPRNSLSWRRCCGVNGMCPPSTMPKLVPRRGLSTRCTRWLATHAPDARWRSATQLVGWTAMRQNKRTRLPSDG